MQKIKFPKTVKVGGIDYKIIFPYTFIDQPSYVGLHNGFSTTLRIADIYQESPRNNQVILETYIHELLHAIDHVYTCNSLDEKYIGVYARALLQVLQDNNLYLYESKVPNKVRVGCFKYKVNHPHSSVESNKGVVASTSNSKLIISIDGDDGAEKFNYQFVKVALLHGIMSAISCIYIQEEDDDNQNIITLKGTNFSHGLYQVLTDNKVDVLINKYKEK